MSAQSIVKAILLFAAFGFAALFGAGLLARVGRKAAAASPL